MAMKWYFTLSQALEQEPYHWTQFCVILRTHHFFKEVGCLVPLQVIQLAYSKPCWENELTFALGTVLAFWKLRNRYLIVNITTYWSAFLLSKLECLTRGNLGCVGSMISEWGSGCGCGCCCFCCWWCFCFNFCCWCCGGGGGADTGGGSGGGGGGGGVGIDLWWWCCCCCCCCWWWWRCCCCCWCGDCLGLGVFSWLPFKERFRAARQRINIYLAGKNKFKYENTVKLYTLTYFSWHNNWKLLFTWYTYEKVAITERKKNWYPFSIPPPKKSLTKFVGTQH